jgi:hypothetical protein
LGIIGVVAGVIPLLFFVAWVLGVLAVVFGIVGRNTARQRRVGRGQATAGAILGAVAIVLGIVGVVIVNNVLTSTKKAVERATFPTSRGGFPTATTASETTAPSVKTYRVGDKATYADGSSIQVYSYEQPVPSPRFANPDPGMEFGLSDVEFCAGGIRSLSYNDLGFKAQMPDNRQYEATFPAARDPDLGSGDIPAGGDCKRGFVTLKVPIGQRPTFVVWDYYGSEQARWAP